MAIIIGDDRPRRVYVVGGMPQSSFAIPFPFFAPADIKVFVGANGVDTELGLGSAFSVVGTGETGGTVNLFWAVSNCTVTVMRRMEIARTTSYPVAGTLRIEALNREAERVIMIAQQLAEQIGRSIKLPPSDDVSDMTLPTAPLRAGRLLGFDSAGNLKVTTTQESFDSILGSATAARNEAVAARNEAVPAAAQAIAAQVAADAIRLLTEIERSKADRAADRAEHEADIATTAATALADWRKGQPTSTLSAWWPSGSRDLGGLDDLTPFLNERMSVTRIDLSRGTGLTRNLGSIT